MASLGDLVVTVGANISGFTSAMTEVSSGLASFGEATEKLLGGLAEKLAFAALAHEAFEAASTIEEAMDTIVKATGATGEKFDQMEGSFKAVFGNAIQSSNDLAGALAVLAQRTQATGEELTALTAINSKFAQVTDQQMTPAVQNTQKVFQAWGIATQDQTDKLDALVAVSQKTGVSVAAITSSLQGAGSVLRTLGMDFNSSAALMANFAAKGLDAERVAGALKIGLTALSKEGVAEPEAAMRGLIQQLVNAKTPMDALALASENFGKRGALYIVDAAQRGGFAINDLKVAADTARGTIVSTAAATESFGEKMDKLKNSTTLLLAPLGKGLLDVLNELVGGRYGLINAAHGMAEFTDALINGSLGFNAAKKGVSEIVTDLERFVVWATNAKDIYEFLTGKSLAMAGGQDAVAKAMEGARKAADPWTTEAMRLAVAQMAADKATSAHTASVLSLTKAFADLGVKAAPTPEYINKITNALEFVQKAYESGSVSLQVYNAAIDAFGKKMKEAFGEHDWIGPIDALGNALKNAGIKSYADELEKLRTEQALAAEAFAAGRIGPEEYAAAIDKTNEAVKKAHPLMEMIIDDLKATGQMFEDIDAQILKNTDAQGQALGALGQKIGELKAPLQDVDAILTSFGFKTVAQTEARIKTLNAQLAGAVAAMKVGVPGAAQAADEALKRLYQTANGPKLLDEQKLGIPDLQMLQMQLDSDVRAYQRLISNGVLTYRQAMEAEITLLRERIFVGQQAGENTDQLQIKLDHMTEALRRQNEGWAVTIRNIHQTMESGLSQVFDDMIFHIDKVADDFKKLGETVVDIFLNHIIKLAIQPALDALDGLLLKLGTVITNALGLTGGGGVLGTTVGAAGGAAGTIGGAAGSTAGTTVSSTAGSAAGAATSAVTSSLTGIVGAVAGVVSAVSGIISNFQLARQEGTLNAIEQHTKVMAIVMAGISAPWEKVADGQDTMFEKFGQIRNALVGNLPWIVEFTHGIHAVLKDDILVVLRNVSDRLSSGIPISQANPLNPTIPPQSAPAAPATPKTPPPETPAQPQPSGPVVIQQAQSILSVPLLFGALVDGFSNAVKSGVDRLLEALSLSDKLFQNYATSSLSALDAERMAMSDIASEINKYSSEMVGALRDYIRPILGDLLSALRDGFAAIAKHNETTGVAVSEAPPASITQIIVAPAVGITLEQLTEVIVGLGAGISRSIGTVVVTIAAGVSDLLKGSSSLLESITGSIRLASGDISRVISQSTEALHVSAVAKFGELQSAIVASLATINETLGRILDRTSSAIPTTGTLPSIPPSYDMAEVLDVCRSMAESLRSIVVNTEDQGTGTQSAGTVTPSISGALTIPDAVTDSLMKAAELLGQSAIHLENISGVTQKITITPAFDVLNPLLLAVDKSVNILDSLGTIVGSGVANLQSLANLGREAIASLADQFQVNFAALLGSVAGIESKMAAPNMESHTTVQQVAFAAGAIVVNGAQDPAATAKAVMDLLKTQSPVFV